MRVCSDERWLVTLLGFGVTATLASMSTTYYQVVVRSRDDLFTAAVLGLDDVAAEGHTREEAIERARAALVERLARGEIVTIEVTHPEGAANVWREQAGRFAHDPTFDDFLAEMREARSALDE